MVILVMDKRILQHFFSNEFWHAQKLRDHTYKKILDINSYSTDYCILKERRIRRFLSFFDETPNLLFPPALPL